MRQDVHGQMEKDGLKKRAGIPMPRGRKLRSRFGTVYCFGKK
jgi:hypothetical protein